VGQVAHGDHTVFVAEVKKQAAAASAMVRPWKLASTGWQIRRLINGGAPAQRPCPAGAGLKEVASPNRAVTCCAMPKIASSTSASRRVCAAALRAQAELFRDSHELEALGIQP